MGGIVSRKKCPTLTAEQLQTCHSVWEAAANGNVSEMARLCALLPISVTARNYDFRAAIHFACAEGQLEAVKFLISQGAEASICDRWGQEPIQEAMLQGHSPVVNFLLEKKVQLSDNCRAELENLMCSSASKGDVATIKALVETGVSINSADYDERTALHIAVASGHARLVNYLISRGANVNSEDRWGETPTSAAFHSGNDEIHAALQGAGARRGSSQSIHGMARKLCIQRPSIANWSRIKFTKSEILMRTDSSASSANPSSCAMCSAATYQLIWASARGDVRTLNKIILAGSALVNDADYELRTALHLACSEGRLKAVKFLIANGADLDATDRWGNVPMQDAIQGGHVDIARLLAQAGASLDAANRADIAFKLCTLAYTGNTQQVARLVDCGIAPDISDVGGRTPLILAAAAGHSEMVKYLLSKSADIRRMDKFGYTAVTAAAAGGHAEVVRLLDDAVSKAATAAVIHKQKNPRDSLAADCLVKALLTTFATTIPSHLNYVPQGQPSEQPSAPLPLSAVSRDCMSVLFMDVAGFSVRSAETCNVESLGGSIVKRASSYSILEKDKKEASSDSNFLGRFYWKPSGSCKRMEEMKKKCELSEATAKLFERFDELAAVHGVQRVGVMCDTYVAVANVAGDQLRIWQKDDHASRLAQFAIAAVDCAAGRDGDGQSIRVKLKAGLHCGSANVVRARHGNAALGGDIIELTSVMVVNSIPGRIQCSEAAAQLIISQDPAVPIEKRDTRVHSGEWGELQTSFLGTSILGAKRRTMRRCDTACLPDAPLVMTASFSE